MPLWDSVQRSLEKASQEAARMAKAQRLRSTIDGLSRQIYTQHNNLLNKTMELFVAGQLTQGELLPFCHELVNLQQQLNQAQAELKQVQANQAQAGAQNQYLPPGTDVPAPSPYAPTPEESAQTTFAPPPPEYQSYLDSTQGMTVAPPPPGVNPLAESATETVRMGAGATPASSPALRRCPACQAELAPGTAFCQNCGSLVQDINSPHLPTVLAGNMEPVYPEGQATVRSDTNAPIFPSPPPVTGAPPARAEKDEGA